MCAVAVPAQDGEPPAKPDPPKVVEFTDLEKSSERSGPSDTHTISVYDGGMPATFVIGQDGKILQYHEGFDPGMTEKLKKELTEAVQEKG